MDALQIYDDIQIYVHDRKCELRKYRKYIIYDNIPDFRSKSLKDLIQNFNNFYSYEFIPFITEIKQDVLECKKISEIPITSINLIYTAESIKILDQKDELLDRINHSLIEFITNNIFFLHQFYCSNIYDLTSKISEYDQKLCFNCKLANSYNSNGKCMFCESFIDENDIVSESIIYENTEEEDMDTKIKNKSRNERRNNWLKKIDLLQGKIIPNYSQVKDVIDIINNYISMKGYASDDLNFELMRKILSEIKQQKYYKFSYYFLRVITGTVPFNFSNDIITLILNEYDILNAAIDEMNVKEPDYLYILFQIVRRLGLPDCNGRDYDKIKGDNKKNEEQNNLKKIFAILNSRDHAVGTSRCDSPIELEGPRVERADNMDKPWVYYHFYECKKNKKIS